MKSNAASRPRARTASIVALLERAQVLNHEQARGNVGDLVQVVEHDPRPHALGIQHFPLAKLQTGGPGIGEKERDASWREARTLTGRENERAGLGLHLNNARIAG